MKHLVPLLAIQQQSSKAQPQKRCSRQDCNDANVHFELYPMVTTKADDVKLATIVDLCLDKPYTYSATTSNKYLEHRIIFSHFTNMDFS